MKISEKGQITIPKIIRDRYGLQKDMEVSFKPVRSGLLISLKKNFKIHPVDEVFGILDRNSSTDSYIEEIRGK